MNNLDRFNSIIKETLAPLFKKNNFKKSGLTWNKKNNEITQVINIQKSKYSDAELVDFTFNLGVFSAVAFEIIWENSAPKVAKEENCLLRTRIGPVIQNDFSGTAKDQWWRIENSTNVDNLARELLDVTENVAMTFLDKFYSINRVEEVMVNIRGWQSKNPQHLLNLAVVVYLTGKNSEAESIISDIITRYEPWKERCLIAARNMGLTGIFK